MDKSLVLDTLKEVPRLVSEDCFMTSVDDKLGYDHILLLENSCSECLNILKWVMDLCYVSALLKVVIFTRAI